VSRAASLPASLSSLLERAPSPAEARTAVAFLLESRPEAAARLEDPAVAAALAQVTGASRSLTRLLLADPEALGVLSDLSWRRPVPRSSAEELARWKRLELLRIAASDLTGRMGLAEVGRLLSAMAEDVLEAACQLVRAPGLAVVGMGKLGGEELNYASDVDVVFAGPPEAEAAARQVMAVARSCFRVDASLRPEGSAGPLVRPVASYCSWWDRWAMAWEIQALIKARAVAGDREVGRDFERQAARRLWGRSFGAEELRQVREMKARAERQVFRRGLGARELKRGQGGIRDVEFAVQLLQLVHGRADPALRVRPTLDALAELASAGYVDAEDAAALADAYRFLRTVEHRLQLVEEAQTHTVPADPAARERLARSMGYRDQPERRALSSFDDDLAAQQARVRSIHERLFFRPLMEAFAQLPGSGRPRLLARGAAEERLAAFGFRDAAQTRAALAELTRGMTRASRLMAQMLPLVLDWLSEAPDPDLGLLGLRNLFASAHLRPQLVAAFRESPETARRLCLVLGTSRLLCDPVRHDPSLLDALGDDASLAALPKADLLARARTALGFRPTRAPRWAVLRRLADSEVFRLAAADLLGLHPLEATEAGLSDLAEALVQAVVEALDWPLPVAVIALGRLGGRELSYASDLDVVLVSADAPPTELARAAATAEELLRVMNGATPAERVWALDADLRPEGRDGPLVRSLSGYRLWYGRWAQPWERQCLLRARPVAGDPEVAARFMQAAEEFVWGRPFTEEDRRHIRRMKARVEQERIPAGEDPQFHLKLGRGSLSDVEWTVQLLQLEAQVRSPSTLQALFALEEAGAIGPEDASVLRRSYEFCERARNRWYLVGSAPGDSLPTDPDKLARLAASLGTTASALREEYRRVTRRARRVAERLFYGMEDPGRNGGRPANW
jgi:glutamate-ammonia-ligase adenylyltransferase